MTILRRYATATFDCISNSESRTVICTTTTPTSQLQQQRLWCNSYVYSLAQIKNQQNKTIKIKQQKC